MKHDPLNKSFSLYITHEDLDPSFISEILSQPSDICHSKKDIKTVRGSYMQHRRGLWSIESARHVRSEEPADHLRCIVDFVTFNRDQLRALIEAGYAVRVRLHWQSDDEVFSVALSASDMAALSIATSGVDIFAG